jgi:hypothetical protein
MFSSNWRPVVLIAGESCLLVGAVAAASYVRLGADTWRVLETENGLWKALLIVGVCQLSLYYADLYDLRGVGGVRDLAARLIEALGATSLILAGIYFLAPDWIVGRGVFLISVVFMVTLVVAWRIVFAWLTKRVAPRERLLLSGRIPPPWNSPGSCSSGGRSLAWRSWDSWTRIRRVWVWRY